MRILESLLPSARELTFLLLDGGVRRWPSTVVHASCRRLLPDGRFVGDLSPARRRVSSRSSTSRRRRWKASGVGEACLSADRFPRGNSSASSAFLNLNDASSYSPAFLDPNYASDSHRTFHLLEDFRPRRTYELLERWSSRSKRPRHSSSAAVARFIPMCVGSKTTSTRSVALYDSRDFWWPSSSSFASTVFSSAPTLSSASFPSASSISSVTSSSSSSSSTRASQSASAILSPRSSTLLSRRRLDGVVPRRRIHFSASAKARKSFNVTRYFDKAPVAEVWVGMTVRELARNVDEEPEEMAASLNLSSVEDRIYDPLLLQDVVRNTPFRCHVVQRFDVPPENPVAKSDLDASPRPTPTEEERLGMPRRHPVVTIMGHVDHGKTTLLDRLRKSNVVSQEFGGITQHIGAFSFFLPSSGSRLTFLDTPGHAAFSAMRGRGANVTDIVILVVAAEDGVMNQTQESIHHAQAANVPIVVAINKIDRPEANVELTKRSLMECGLTLEDIGGDVMCVPISALVGTNVDQLMEAVLTQAELLDLRADPTGAVEATVIETRQVEGRGKLATVLVQRGTLKTGAFLVGGDEGAECKVKALNDAEGKSMKEAKPAEPVEVTGWKELPNPGDKVLQLPNQKRLRQVVAFRKEEVSKQKFLEAQKIVEQQKISDRQNYEAHFAKRVENGRRRLRIADFRRDKEEKSPVDFSNPFLNVILRGDVDGSLEAILNVFDSFHDERCKLDVVNFGIGPPTTSDVDLASTFKCLIYCFNLRVPGTIEALARENGVEILHFNVIYRLFEHMKTEMTARLPPLYVDEVIGVANVMQPFVITDVDKKKRPVAGSQCIKGELLRDARFKLIRAGTALPSSSSSSASSESSSSGADEGVVFDGPLFALKHLKEDVKSISQGMDCGIALNDVQADPQPGDQILCYRVKEVKQFVDWDLDF